MDPSRTAKSKPCLTQREGISFIATMCLCSGYTRVLELQYQWIWEEIKA